TASTLTDTASGSIVVPGREITYTLTATNHGPSDSFNPVITDVIPTGTTWARSTQPAGWTCTPVSAGAAAGTPVTCTTSSLANAAKATYVLVVKTDSSATQATPAIVNTATVTSDTGETPDTFPDTATKTTV